ncbi:MAG: nucleotide excision repair endonuclease [Chitinispirillales bacterium]|jgi:hypothetical protein|nr:nucleotide excision repair endonuclease [Chitinispirillales bacterium]
MNDEIITFIREHPNGATSEIIAEQFLKFKNPNKMLADAAVRAILSKDMRVQLDESGGIWVPNATASRSGDDETEITDTEWVSVYLLADIPRKSIVHISLWSPLPEPRCIVSAWLKDPAHFSEEDREMLTDPRDMPFNSPVNIANVHDSQHLAATSIEQIVRELAGKVPIFFSQQQYAIFSWSAQNHGVGIDDYYLMNQLLRAVKEPECKPLTIDNAASAILGSFRTAESAYRQGELFCRITAELIGQMKSSGIENRGQLDERLCEESKFDFADKEITREMIDELPMKAGVYGFTDKSGAYIYIGKAVNLRRRIENYFRFNSESPDKLGKLRAAAHSLTIHRCGSELEALIYEYRLIKKHKPPLNSHSAISERKGEHKPLSDMVLMLPHAQEGFCVSLWIRKDQKIRLRSFELDFCEEETIIKELREYFYSGTLPISSDDFPELEIVTRWVKRNRDSVSTILVGNLVDAEEIVEAMRNV